MPSPIERLKRSVTHDNLWIYVLKNMKQRGVYAYELNALIERRFRFRPGNVTAYLVLKKLELGGYVRKAKATQAGGPERNNYRITAKGIRELAAARPVLRAALRSM